MRFVTKLALISLSATIVALSLPNNSWAQSTNQPSQLGAIYACKTLVNSTERLACYDKAVGQFQAAEKSGEVVTISKTEVKRVEREAFGFNIPSLSKIGKILGLGNSSKKAQKDIFTADPAIDSGDAAAQRIKYTDNNTIESIVFDIDKITTFQSIKKRFFFKNGQVWEQITGANVTIPKGDAPMTASITKGRIGGYRLRLNDKGWKVKVRRVR